MKAEKVSIYNPAVQPKHPLNGLRLTNSTELHLMQGPITVFDGGVYAGDAKIDDIAPGSQRLLSYALDLDTEVAPESKGQPEQLVSVRLVKGDADRRPQVHADARVHDEELRPQGEEGARRVPARPDLDAGRAQGAGREDPRPLSLRRRGQAGRAGQAAWSKSSGPSRSSSP